MAIITKIRKHKGRGACISLAAIRSCESGEKPKIGETIECPEELITVGMGGSEKSER
jgi:hypothetical protein